MNRAARGKSKLGADIGQERGGWVRWEGQLRDKRN